MEYRVELDVFNGPLDLLLYLIRREEVEITDIPIARITDSYMRYMATLRELRTRDGIDINVAGDFLVMAATLMEIKSAMLLPRPAEEAGASSAAAELADPRYELVKQLLDYKRFRESASRLESMARDHAERFPRYPVVPGAASDEPPPLDLEEVQVWDLLAAFNRLLAEVGKRSTVHEVIFDDTPQALHAADIEDRLTREGPLTLRALLVGRRSRSEMIGVFLALLELIRQRKVTAAQETAEGEVVISPAAALAMAPSDADDAPLAPTALPATEPSASAGPEAAPLQADVATDDVPPLHIAEKSREP